MQSTNDTGFNLDTDFYSLLNLEPSSDQGQIEKQFRNLSRSIHPDKYRPAQTETVGIVGIEAGQVVTDELSRRQEIFQEVQRAYVYLTNPLTKVIYDEFSVPGLAVYEKSKHKFDSLQNEIREINAQVELLRRPLRTSNEEREEEVLRRI